MKENTSKNKTSVGVGASSILVIFVVLCLVTFAVLSLVSAKADKNLSGKSVEHLKEYYEAENTAYFALGQIDKILADLYVDDSAGYKNAVKNEFSANEDITVIDENGIIRLEYSVEISETQELSVEISVDTPKNAKDGFYTITRWQTVSTAQWHPSGGMAVLTK